MVFPLMALAQHHQIVSPNSSSMPSPKPSPQQDSLYQKSNHLPFARSLPPLESSTSHGIIPSTQHSSFIQPAYLTNGQRDSAWHTSSDPNRSTPPSAAPAPIDSYADNRYPFYQNFSKQHPNTLTSDQFQFNPRISTNNTNFLNSNNANMNRRGSYQDGPVGAGAFSVQSSSPDSRRPSIISEYSIDDSRDSKESVGTSGSEQLYPYDSTLRRHSIAVTDTRSTAALKRKNSNEEMRASGYPNGPPESYRTKRRESAFDTRLSNLSLYDRRNSYASSAPSSPPRPLSGYESSPGTGPGPDRAPQNSSGGNPGLPHQQLLLSGGPTPGFHPNYSRQQHAPHHLAAAEGAIIGRRASMPIIQHQHDHVPPPVPPIPQTGLGNNTSGLNGMEIDPRYRYPVPPMPQLPSQPNRPIFTTPSYGDPILGHGAITNPMVQGLMKETPYSRSPELRVSHKLAERKRRKEMKELFDELRDSLPVDKSLKTSKWEILSKAVDYIASLKHNETEMIREVHSLKNELARYRQQEKQQPHNQDDYQTAPQQQYQQEDQQHHPQDHSQEYHNGDNVNNGEPGSHIDTQNISQSQSNEYLMTHSTLKSMDQDTMSSHVNETKAE